ncbi:MAG: M48 family metalloprotease [Desulfobacterales bacterium]|nr:M48 family metalloprotease [Desulfobacterales bacterium]
MIKKILFFLTLLLFSTQFVFADTIQNNNVSLRSGAGAFFPVIKVLKKGDYVKLIKKNRYWYKVKLKNGKKGWISTNSFGKVKKSINYGLVSRDLSGRSISKLMVTAAVKGFFENKINSKNLNKDLFKQPYKRYLDPFKFMNFKQNTFSGRLNQYSYRDKYKIDYKSSFNITEDMFATSSFVAARLGAPGLINDKRLTQYVNSVAQLIVESTEFFDFPITVHIVNTNAVFANATPIGVIMISKGMLKVIQSENELACLLAHEISHVTLGHGITEAGKRKHMIKAESAFGELDDATDKDDADMDELANEMYERSIKGRKAKYEMAADQRGAIYAFRAGYDFNGMATLLNRIKSTIPVSQEAEDASHWLPMGLKKRINSLNNFTSTVNSDSSYKTFKNRYLRYTR